MTFVETSSMKNSTIMYLYSEKDQINLNPDYQRMGGVWTREKRQLLMDSILNDYDIPKIYFHELSKDEAKRTGLKYAVIDGRQRLESIWEFMDGGFALSDDFEYQRDRSLQLSGLGYEDIAKGFPKIKVKFDSFVLPVVIVSVEGDEVDLIEDMFSRLNEAVPLNAAEKRNAVGGDLVKAIADIAQDQFFTSKVRFKNTRYQHRESAARFLLVEDSMARNPPQLVDTKKVYLDSMAKRYAKDHLAKVADLQRSIQPVLQAMSNEFMDKDELLAAQGTLVVYYLVFRQALATNTLHEVTRQNLLMFRRALSENRDAAAKNYEGALFDLLEFDRLNQQGTNDASSIRERCRILCEYLRVPPLSF